MGKLEDLKEIGNLAELKNQGIINEAEFEKEKEKILKKDAEHFETITKNEEATDYENNTIPKIVSIIGLLGSLFCFYLILF